MDEIYLKVFIDRSELYENGGIAQVFKEGIASDEAKKRYSKIKDSLEEGYLIDIIENLIDGNVFSAELLDDEQLKLLHDLVDSVTSEVGRALVAITILQLTVKAISPDQSIMLHKGSASTKSFSWEEGLSMRSLDKYYITPVLRKYELVRLNADGFMMTRSLAENYPYSKIYKAKLRGARDEWLEIISELENDKLPALEALRYVLSLLINRASNFTTLADETIAATSQIKVEGFDMVFNLIENHIMASGYKARLFEIAMHSYCQALDDIKGLNGLTLKPLSQMRSANKKHGNIGDIELLEGPEIVSSWDAKYGKEYLRDEIEELYDKIASRKDTLQGLGFVVNGNVTIDDEIKNRISEISELSGQHIEILNFKQWVTRLAAENKDNSLPEAWLMAYVETLGQKRRAVAPIDEPCNAWLESFLTLITS